MLAKAIRMFEVSRQCSFKFVLYVTHRFQDFLQYTNHVGLCTEEISEAGDGYESFKSVYLRLSLTILSGSLGNAVQGFTYVSHCIYVFDVVFIVLLRVDTLL